MPEDPVCGCDTHDMQLKRAAMEAEEEEGKRRRSSTGARRRHSGLVHETRRRIQEQQANITILKRCPHALLHTRRLSFTVTTYRVDRVSCFLLYTL